MKPADPDDNDTPRQHGSKITAAVAAERPLAGAVICCTSIAPEVRSRLAEWIQQMGAEHRLDLTSDVTHLLVASTDTPKYKYVARERDDVTVLRPEWVDAVRKYWMNAQAINLNALTAEYRLPTFAGLKICVTGFDDLNFRAGLQQNVIENGGQYTGDLTKDVTHLIAAKPEGKKYEYATQWQRKVVSLQWYADTLKRGLQLEESLYHPTRPITEQGLGAWNRKDPPESQLGKRAREEPAGPELSRKLRRTASARLGSQSDNIWTDIVGGGFEDSEVDRPTLRPTKSMPTLDVEKQTPSHDSLQASKDSQPQNVSIGDGYLEGKYFTIQGFDRRRREKLEQILLEKGAIVLETLQQLKEAAQDAEKILIVPHTTPANRIRPIFDSATSLAVVSEFWLEFCMYQKRYISPQLYPLCSIMPQTKPPGFSQLRINATEFSGIQALHISKVVNALGGQYEETFTCGVSALICNNGGDSVQKLKHAQMWQVPVVSISWLVSCIREGRLASFEKHLIEQPALLRTERTEDREKSGSRDRTARESTRLPGSDFLVHQDSRDTRLPKPNAETMDVAGKVQPEHRGPVLQEISPNSPPKPQPSEPEPEIRPKKRLFQTLDGASSFSRDTENNQISDLAQADSVLSHPPYHNDIASEIRDFYSMKAKSSNSIKPNSLPKNRKLQGRALSNLSNGSATSRRSRASSIDSVNTDGIGSEIAPSGKDKSQEPEPRFTGRAKSRLFENSDPAPTSLGLGIGLGINESLANPEDFVPEEAPPQMTQLRYDESDDTIALREKLAARRRARSRLGQKDGDPSPVREGDDMVDGKDKDKDKDKESRRIRDDDLIANAGWGGGRRTRQKASPKGLKF